jgi:sialic acid synthase
MQKIKLTENKVLGDNETPFVIAEIGNNHNGDIEIAKKLIQNAKDIGVDAVKFQVKDIESSFSKELLDGSYTGPNSFGKTYREHKEALEFSEEQLRELYEYAKKLNIICFATPFDVNSVDLLERLDNPIYKISSFHVIDLNLIEKICQTKKPILMSTGMSTLDEIDKAMEIIKKHTDQVALFQCTSSYPTDDEDVNLNVIPALKKRYDCPVGYSGHERGTAITIASVAVGGCMVERHFTLDRSMKGPDHAASLEVTGMSAVVERIKKTYVSLGTPEKNILESELKNRKKFRGY